MKATRQRRIFGKEKILRDLPSLTGKKINIVLADDTTLTGLVVSVTPHAVTLENMRLKEIILPLSEITEIFIDTQAEC